MNELQIMKKVFLFLFFFNLYFQLNGQLITIQSKITDENSFSISDFTIFVNKHEIIPDLINDLILFKVHLGDTITIKHFEYYPLTFITPARLTSDTLKQIFTLTSKDRMIDEVTITARFTKEKYKKIAGKFNENILDYIINPTTNTITSIYDYKHEYYLGYTNDSITKTHLLTIHPESLYLDCMGNIYILTKDSVYQIYISDLTDYTTISYMTLNQFNYSIKNLIYKDKQTLFYEKKSDYNQRYTVLKQYTKSYQTCIYSTFDLSSFNLSRKDFMDLLYLYHTSVDEKDNIIRTGKWDGDFTQLAINKEIDLELAHYKNTFAKAHVDSYAFGMIKSLCIINVNQNQLIKINYDSDFKTITPIDLRSLNNINILYDYYFDNLHILASFKGSKTVFYLNEKSGILTKIGDFNGIYAPTKIKVYGNTVYYLKRNDSGFNKLYKLNPFPLSSK